MNKHATAADIARLVRADLKATFPKITFSVRSKSYAGGSSVRINWMDGPTQARVDALVNKYQGCDFDSMQDLKTYRDNPYGSTSWVGTERHYSEAFMRAALAEIEVKYAMPSSPILVVGASGRAWLDTWHMGGPFDTIARQHVSEREG